MKKLLLSAALLSFSTLLAQWNYSPAVNNAICVQPNEQINSKPVSDLKGGAIIVWEDYRNDPTNTLGDIYAQRISAAGNIMWTVNGVAICTDAANQAAPVIVPDSLGGAIIVWQDHRGLKRNLYAQRIDSLGVVQWTANGVGVELRNYDQKNPKLLNDGANGAIVLWQDSVGNDYDVYAQRLNSAGAAQWPGGIGIATGFGSQVNVKAQISTAAGQVFVTWQDKRNGSDYDIYVQRLDLSGSVAWTANGINLCTFAGTQSGPKIALDNNGGAIILWQDKRNGLDYDVYAQRVNSSGAIQWTSNGVAVAVAPNNQSSVDLTTKNIANGAIFGWKDARNGTNNFDVYVQMMNLSGVAQWVAGGIPVANAAANQQSMNISSDGIGGAIVSYQDSSAGNWDIRSQRVNAAGSLLWGTGVDIGTATFDQTNPGAMLADNYSSIYCFEDKRNGTDRDIYAYKIDANGVPVSVRSFQQWENLLQVYPNPSGGPVTIDLKGMDFGNQVTLDVFDALGNKVTSEEMKGARTLYMNNKLSPGVYSYRVSGSTRTANGKFIIQD